MDQDTHFIIVTFSPFAIAIFFAVLWELDRLFGEWKERKHLRRERAYQQEAAKLIASKSKTRTDVQIEFNRLQKNGTLAMLRKKHGLQ
jgi:hypothetical protein